ncbi:hypothetical protein ACFRH9_17215 [Peribacillus butanolivorans]|uniref:hypothetical protein n=1 Tax=Peribacillus butanolivorans TaxID=421767 RepID=UPI00366C7CC4
MIRVTNALLSLGIMIVVTGICLSLDFNGFILLISVITFYFFPYFLLRYVRDHGYDDTDFEKQIGDLNEKLSESENERQQLELNIKRLEDKLEVQKELVELSKAFSGQTK